MSKFGEEDTADSWLLLLLLNRIIEHEIYKILRSNLHLMKLENCSVRILILCGSSILNYSYVHVHYA